MAFSAQELANIANAALDFYIKGKPLSQSLQDRPLLAAMRARQKTFAGGKGAIRGNVKNDYATSFVGYSHNDTVAYVNPANIKQFDYDWYELHAGISLTHTELKKAGISVTDTNGEGTSNHSQRELTEISNLLEDKLEDMDEGTARSLNNIFWQDGTQGAKAPPGLLYFLPDVNGTGVVGGIDRATSAWWRHRACTTANGLAGGEDKITASAANQTLTKKLRSEVRQLRRYGGKPKLVLAGSDFIEALELEVHEKGTYTQDGFVKNGTLDIGMADISMRGVGKVMYDPTLDDLGRSKFGYFIDTDHLYPYVMEGEDMKPHNPARPADKYVLYRGLTWTGAMVGRKMNAHGVYEVA